MLRDGTRLTLESVRAFEQALDEILAAAGNGPAALIVTSEGKVWNNGIDLEQLARADQAERDAFVPALNHLLGRLMTFPLPTVAAINGHAFAGGAILALAFDYRVMRQDRGWICLPEIDLHIPFPRYMLDLLRTKLPAYVVRDAVLTGARYPAEQAIPAHLIDEACPEHELLARAAARVAPLAEKSRASYARFKLDLYGDIAKSAGYEPGNTSH